MNLFGADAIPLGVPEPMALTVLLILVFIPAGFVHVAWLNSPFSARFRQPVDGGMKYRGRRLFGDNKALRGFMALTPTAGLMFALIGILRGDLPPWLASGTWALFPWQYGLLGCLAGFGCMAGELPNSFIKRQLDIAPGQITSNRWFKGCFYALDRVDSLLGTLVALSLAVPIPGLAWVYVLMVFPFIHLGFSALLYYLKIKPRLA